jgi:hypothetical protein
MKANVNLNVLRKEIKEQTGTYFYCVGILYNVVENCPSLKAILPKSKTKAKEEQYEIGCKEFVKYGQTLQRKIVKIINGEKSTIEITYVKNKISVDEVLRYFLHRYNESNK